jgi:hypothetical protein
VTLIASGSNLLPWPWRWTSTRSITAARWRAADRGSAQVAPDVAEVAGDLGDVDDGVARVLERVVAAQDGAGR